MFSKTKTKWINPNESNRDNWIIEKLNNLKAGSSILDVGAGEMRYKNNCSHLNYISQDFCQYKGAMQGNVSKGLLNETWDTSKIDIVSDIISIPVEDNSFDAILCSEVFEHIPYPIKAIEEFKRILKSRGILILTAPFCSLAHQTPYYFYNGYSIDWYKKFLEENNFIIIEMKANGNFFDYMLQELNRVKSCSDLYCKNTKIKYPKQNIKKVCQWLQECSENQLGSENILCFGYHILAQKI